MAWTNEGYTECVIKYTKKYNYTKIQIKLYFSDKFKSINRDIDTANTMYMELLKDPNIFDIEFIKY